MWICIYRFFRVFIKHHMRILYCWFPWNLQVPICISRWGGGGSSVVRACDFSWEGHRFYPRFGRPLHTGWVGFSMMSSAETEVMVTITTWHESLSPAADDGRSVWRNSPGSQVAESLQRKTLWWHPSYQTEASARSEDWTYDTLARSRAFYKGSTNIPALLYRLQRRSDNIACW